MRKMNKVVAIAILAAVTTLSTPPAFAGSIMFKTGSIMTDSTTSTGSTINSVLLTVLGLVVSS